MLTFCQVLKFSYFYTLDFPCFDFAQQPNGKLAACFHALNHTQNRYALINRNSLNYESYR